MRALALALGQEIEVSLVNAHVDDGDVVVQ